jgi:hypothetical protein
MCSFPSATLIRLYEFLKNSRCHRSNLLIDRYQSTSKHPDGRGCFDVDCIQAAPRVLRMRRAGGWWRMTGSNRRPPACKAGALPAELIPRVSLRNDEHLVGLVGLEPTTPALSRRCSNQLSYRPKPVTRTWCSTQPLATSFQQPISVSVELLDCRLIAGFFQKGGDPAAPSDTATLLRLHPSHEPRRGNRPPCG